MKVFVVICKKENIIICNQLQNLNNDYEKNLKYIYDAIYQYLEEIRTGKVHLHIDPFKESDIFSSNKVIQEYYDTANNFE